MYALAPVVKWISCLPSKQLFQVRILAGAHITKNSFRRSFLLYVHPRKLLKSFRPGFEDPEYIARSEASTIRRVYSPCNGRNSWPGSRKFFCDGKRIIRDHNLPPSYCPLIPRQIFIFEVLSHILGVACG